MPESLIRVQRLSGKLLKFYEADLCRVDELREVFKKVIAKVGQAKSSGFLFTLIVKFRS